VSDLFESMGEEPFEAAEGAGETEALVLDIGGWEGPLHLLLALARKNKVDLAEISMMELAEQYLVFVNEARRKRLDIAAEYLVMAAWLTYLKSRLLLPKPRPDDDEPEPEVMAAALAFRLRRLEAMRAAGDALYNRALLGRDVFARGAPEGVRSIRTPAYEAELYDLLKAYAARRERKAFATYKPAPPKVYGLEQARKRLSKIATRLTGWERFDALLPDDHELGSDAPSRASVTASSLLAALEITKEGDTHIRQDATYEPIWMRAAECAQASEPEAEEERS
jgi:segregation and condensation protein A